MRDTGRRADRHRAGSAGTAGHRAGADDPAGRAGLLGLPGGRHPGGPLRSAGRHRAGGHHADPAGRVRAGRRPARRHPGPAPGAPGGGAGLRGDRRVPTPVRPSPRPRAACPDGPYDLEVASVWAGYPGCLPAGAAGCRPLAAAGRRVAVVGPSGAGKSTLAAVLLRFLTLSGRVDHLGRTPIERAGRRRRAHGRRSGRPGRLPVRRHHRREPARRQAGRHGRRAARRPRAGRAGRLVRRSARGPGHRGRPARRPAVRRPAPAGGRGPCPARPTSRCWCSTSRPSISIPRPPTRSPPTCSTRPTGRSLVLITHRLTGLESVDEILVMEAGRVVERGTHDELLARRDGTPTSGGRR